MRPTGRAALHRALLASLVVLAACGDPEPPPYAGGAPSSALDLAGRESPGMPRPVGTHCYNCLKDVDETDVECGGSCRPCPGWVPTFECEDIHRAPRCGCFGPCGAD